MILEFMDVISIWDYETNWELVHNFDFDSGEFLWLMLRYSKAIVIVSPTNVLDR